MTAAVGETKDNASSEAASSLGRGRDSDRLDIGGVPGL
jgi:hypothetical protein